MGKVYMGDFHVEKRNIFPGKIIIFQIRKQFCLFLEFKQQFQVIKFGQYILD